MSSTLKILSDVECQVYCDYEYKGDVVPGTIFRIDIRKGTYFLEFKKDNVVLMSQDYEMCSNDEEQLLRVTLSDKVVEQSKKIQRESDNVLKVFSVSKDMKVVFSPGNLQYQASTNKWRFAENPWDCVGEDNKNISPLNSGWIDMFGWCMGNPTKSSKFDSHYPSFNDWGNYCGLPTPEGTTGKWRTLTYHEWKYVMFERTTSSGVRYAKARVSGVDGIIVVPDGWNKNIYSLNSTNNRSVNFGVNVISASTWESILEPEGCVFLPATGLRYGFDVSLLGSDGVCRSSTPDGSDLAYKLYFSSGAYFVNNSRRLYGHSVRLVALPQN